MISKNNIYPIFFLSLLLHIGVIFFIRGINFNNSTIIQNNSVVVDLETFNNNFAESTPNTPDTPVAPPVKINQSIKKFAANNFQDITPPDITNIKTTYNNYNDSQLNRIPDNIPTNYKPVPTNNFVSKSLKRHNSITPNKKVKSGGKTNNLNLIKSYFAIVREEIEKNKKYPFIARKMGIEGITSIEFTIKHNGLVSNIKILKSSGSTILDKAAVTAINLAAPFPQIPDKLKLKNITLKLSLIFKLN